MLGFPHLDLVLIDHRCLDEQDIACVGAYLTFDRFDIPQAQQLPNSVLAVLDALHFVWEDAADEYAALVSSWWTAHRPNINPPR
jgi:hypothetical protein